MARMRPALAASRGRMAGSGKPSPPWGQAMRTEAGRPSSSMRFKSMDGDVHLGCPTLFRAVTDHLFEPADGRLGAYSTHGEHRFHAMAGTNSRPSRAGSSADLIMESGTWLGIKRCRPA